MELGTSETTTPPGKTRSLLCVLSISINLFLQAENFISLQRSYPWPITFTAFSAAIWGSNPAMLTLIIPIIVLPSCSSQRVMIQWSNSVCLSLFVHNKKNWTSAEEPIKENESFKWLFDLTNYAVPSTTKRFKRVLFYAGTAHSLSSFRCFWVKWTGLCSKVGPLEMGTQKLVSSHGTGSVSSSRRTKSLVSDEDYLSIKVSIYIFYF